MDQVKRFEEVVAKVLEEPDPRYELDGDKRWLAGIYGKVRTYSEPLIGGLAGSIAQFAVNAEAATWPQGREVANRLVRRLLMPTKDRDLRWRSLAKWLPDLAEAAPDEFLEAAEALIADVEATRRVFEEERGGVFSSSMHTYLLWALERLAWNPDYLSRTTVILGRLDAVDPGGQLGNRPNNSLLAIYVPWCPSTDASPTRRMDAIRALYDRCPIEGWRLTLRLLPRTHEVASPTAVPRWRSWKPETRIKVTIGEYWQFIENLVAALLEWVKDDTARWVELVEQYPELQCGHPELGDKVMSGLEAVDARVMTDDARYALATQIREMVTRHRRVADAEWVLDENCLRRLQGLYDKFAPDDPVQKKGWLFKSWPDLPERNADTHEDRQVRLLTERRSLVEEVYVAEGVSGVRRLADAVEKPEEVGAVFALVEPDDNLMREFLVEGLSLTPTKQNIPVQLRLVWGVIWRRVKDKGLGWAQEQGNQLIEEVGDHGLANLVLPIRAEGPVWDVVDGWDESVRSIYWKQVDVHCLPEAERDLERAVQQLVKAARPYRAIDVLGMSLRRTKRKDGGEGIVLPVDRQIVISLLQDTPKTLPEDEWYPVSMSTVSHAVGELLQWLEDVGVDDKTLAQLEWLWLAALEHDRRGLVVLQRYLSTDPKLFVDLLGLIFRAEGEKPTEVSEEQQASIKQASRLLRKWSMIPGTVRIKQGDGDDDKVKIDHESLRQWVTEARRLAAECGHLTVCDAQIGEVLAHAPHDDDGTWPCEAVRNVIEDVSSTKLDHGFHIGEMNKRGVHFRTPGGDQERELAAKYRGYRDCVIDRWPRTGAILDGVRQSYEDQAKWHDERDQFAEFAD